MSSLIYITQPNFTIVATDTLATDGTGEPILFTSKALLLPHLRIIICGIGAGAFMDRWILKVNTGIRTTGVVNLDRHTPALLRELWSEYSQEWAEKNASLTTTIYHFGVGEETEQMTSFAYRSTNGFASECLACGVGIKPECPLPDVFNDPEADLLALMVRQQELESVVEPSRRVYIGGQGVMHYLTPSQSVTKILGNLPGFQTARDTIMTN